jgi:hypothetical protein
MTNINDDDEEEDEKERFELTQEHIDTIYKAASYIETIGNFASWSANNIRSINIKECYSIMEDFVKSNEYIIQRINKVRPSLP